MNITLGVVAAVILAVIAAVWAFGRRERKAGQDEVRADVAVQTVDTVQKSAAAQANAPKSKSDVVDRLRGKGL